MFDRIQIVPTLQARWRSAMLVWVAFVAAVAALTLSLPARYEATAALVVEMNAADPMRGQEVFRPSGTPSSYLATQAEVIKSEAPGLLGSEAIKWNFTKFLVDRSGKVVKRYAPQTKPEDIARDIESLL